MGFEAGITFGVGIGCGLILLFLLLAAVGQGLSLIFAAVDAVWNALLAVLGWLDDWLNKRLSGRTIVRIGRRTKRPGR